MLAELLSLKKNALLIGGVALAFSIAIGIEELRIHNIRADLTTEKLLHDICKANLAVSQANEAVLTVRIEQQNSAIEQMRLDGEAKDKALRAAVQKQIAIRNAAKQKFASIGTGSNVMNAWIRSLYEGRNEQ